MRSWPWPTGRLRRPRIARSLSETLQSHRLHHPLTAGRRPLRAGCASQAGTDRKTPPEGLSCSEPLGGGRRPKDNLAAHYGEQLVRRWRTPGGDRLKYRHLVQHGIAGRAITLGADPRPPRRVRHPGSVVYRPWRRSEADHLMVCEALADGSYLPRGTAAPGL